MNKQNPLMTRAIYLLLSPVNWVLTQIVERPKTSMAILAILTVIAVGMFTGWGPRNAQGWPIP